VLDWNRPAVDFYTAMGATMLVQGEVPLGMARAGLLPRWFGRTGARDVRLACCCWRVRSPACW
jgi:hypothetical protein